MAILTNQDGTPENDILTYDKGGTTVVYHTQGGNDQVEITGGKIALVNDKGADTISITGGQGHSITGVGTSVEKLTLQGGNAVEAQLGDGRDSIIIYESDGLRSGSWSAIRGGGWTDTFLVEDGAKNYQLYGEAGDDVFYIGGGQNINFWGGAANDTFEVRGGLKNKFYGGDSADSFQIYASEQNMILGYGNDLVEVFQGDKQQIKGNLGINQINLWSGAGHILTADIDRALSLKKGYTEGQVNQGLGLGYGVDQVLIDGATQVTAHLGDGKDVVEIKGGDHHEIHTEGWGDTLKVSGTTSDSLIDGGDGDDTFILDGGSNNTFYGGAGKDTFTLKRGEESVIYTGAGNDTVDLFNGSVKHLNLGAGNNKFNLNGGRLSQLELASGSVSLNGNGKGQLVLITDNRQELEQNHQLQLSGKLNISLVELGAGGDNVTIVSDEVVIDKLALGDGANVANLSKGQLGNLSFGKDRDELNLKGIRNLSTHMGAGADMVNISAGTELEVYGDEDGDTFTITGGTNIKAIGGAGEDTFMLSNGNGVTLEGGLDKDFFYIQGGSKVTAKGEEGDDEFTVTSGQAYLLQGGEGADRFTLKGGSGHRVYGDAGDDLIEVWTQVQEVYSGEGDDRLEVKDGTVKLADLGAGENLLNMTGGTLETLQISNGKVLVSGTSGHIDNISAGYNSQLEVSGTSVVDTITLGAGKKELVLDKAALGTLKTESGTNNITLRECSVDTYEFGNSEDHVLLENMTDTVLNTGAGDDVIKVISGRNLELDGGSGKDTIFLQGGSDIVVNSSGYEENTIYVENGNNINLSSNSGKNNYLISGGSNISLNGSNSGRVDIQGGQFIEIQGYGSYEGFSISGGDHINVKNTGSNNSYQVKGGDLVNFIVSGNNNKYAFQQLQEGASYVVDLSEISSSYHEEIDFQGYTRDQLSLEKVGADIILTHANGATVTIKNWVHNGTGVKFADTELLSQQALFGEPLVADISSQAAIIKTMMKHLDYSSKNGMEALNDAISFASKGLYEDINQLAQEYKGRLLSLNTTNTNAVKNFYLEYCGINLDNADTGAITGYDAGGSLVKTAESILPEPEGLTVEDFVYDTSNTIRAIDWYSREEKEFYATNINGLTVYWDEGNVQEGPGNLSVKKQIIGGVNNSWMELAMDLIEESYGISIVDEYSNLQRLEDGTRALQIGFYNADINTLAHVKTNYKDGQTLSIIEFNTDYLSKAVTDVNGNSLSSQYTDRLLAHELVHVVMINAMEGFAEMPKIFTEGMAEVVHGIDDFRYSNFINIAKNTYRVDGADNKTYAEALNTLFDVNKYGLLYGSPSYAAGYSLMRYYAKQVYEYGLTMGFADGAMGDEDFAAGTKGLGEADRLERSLVYGNSNG